MFILQVPSHQDSYLSNGGKKLNSKQNFLFICLKWQNTTRGLIDVVGKQTVNFHFCSDKLMQTEKRPGRNQELVEVRKHHCDFDAEQDIFLYFCLFLFVEKCRRLKLFITNAVVFREWDLCNKSYSLFGLLLILGFSRTVIPSEKVLGGHPLKIL